MVLVRNEYYYDTLDEEELAFLKKKAKKESRLHVRILKIMFAGAIVFSFAGAWENIQEEGKIFDTKTVFSWENYFLTLGILALFFYASMRWLRNTDLALIQRDLRQKTKIIERVQIERKTFLPHNNTFHFYLNSTQKLSIEVKEKDFLLFDEGDEISIEYSTHAGVYFGYF